MLYPLNRKGAALSLASVMALSLAACGGNSGGDGKGSDDSSAKTEGEGDKAEGEKSDSGTSCSVHQGDHCSQYHKEYQNSKIGRAHV